MGNKSKSTQTTKQSKKVSAEAHFQIHINPNTLKEYFLFILAMIGFYTLIAAMSQCGKLELGQPRDQGLIAVGLVLLVILGASLVWYEYRRPDYVMAILLPLGLAMLY